MKGMPLVSSKLLDRKWRSREQQIHKERLRSVKSSIRTLQTTPLIPTCMIRNFKKEEMNESKQVYNLFWCRTIHWDREGKPDSTWEDDEYNVNESD